MKKGITLILLLALLVSLYGCGETQSTQGTMDNTQSSEEFSVIQVGTEEVKTYPLPEENRKALTESLDKICPSTQGGYYFVSGEYLRYATLDEKGSIALCAQSGCKHTDSACQAYMGGTIQQMIEYQGMIYAIVLDDYENPSLVSHSASGGTYQTLLSWDAWDESDEQNISTQISLYLAAHGKLYYSVTRDFYNPKTGDPLSEDERVTMEYNIATGETRELPEEGLICTGKAGYVMRLWDQDYDETQQKYVINEAQLRLYDPETWEYTVIADYEQDGFLPTADPALRYGDLTPYQCGNTLYLFDAGTGEKRELLTAQEPIIIYWIMDHKVFYITRTEDKYTCVYYADIDDGIPVQLENQGNTESMVCSISFEGNDFFSAPGFYTISKEDFYNENYD